MLVLVCLWARTEHLCPINTIALLPVKQRVLHCLDIDIEERRGWEKGDGEGSRARVRIEDFGWVQAIKRLCWTEAMLSRQAG